MSTEKPWKVLVNADPDYCQYSLVSLRDLLNGTSLDNNVIIYNGEVYTGGDFQGTATSSDQLKWGIDIYLPIIDSNAVDIYNTYTVKKGESTFNFKVYPKDVFVYPAISSATVASMSHAAIWNHSADLIPNRTTWDDSSNTVNLGYAKILTNIGSTSPTSIASAGTLCLYKQDTVFASTMKFEENKSAFNKIKLNPNYIYISNVLSTILSSYAIDGSASAIKSFVSNSVSDLIAAYNNSDDTTGIYDLFGNIYVLVKAPMAADYINPDDYNQSLNQEASVVHSNLLITDHADELNNFNRFKEYVYSNKGDTDDESADKTRITYPYYPKNTPLKDLLSDKILSIQGINSDSKTLYADIDKAGRTNGSNIGSVLSPIDISPWNYYDPYKTDNEITSNSLKRLPALIGKYGNIVTDGRIISPTIDELWYIIKKLISGYCVSTDKNIKSSYISGQNTNDTSLKEVVDNQFVWNQLEGTTDPSVKGDPINWEEIKTVDQDAQTTTYSIKVTEWLSQPTKFNHIIYDNITNISNNINTFYKSNNNEATDKLISATNIYKNLINNSANDKDYGPRSTSPYSLRELEALIAGNKFNIDNNFEFNSKTYAVTGQFGKKITESGIITSAGSLYQMHRDYNADVTNPNTYFKLNGNGTESNPGYDATFGDLENDESENNLYLLNKNNKKTETKKVSKMPLLVKNYGNSSAITKEQGSYTGADVYLAADGTWRYKAEHMRLPILREAY